MALTEAGPQQYRPEGEQKSHRGPLLQAQAGQGCLWGWVPPFSQSLTVACLLRRSVQHLPASISRREVVSGHPAFIPDMEIPEGEARAINVR